MNLGREQGRSGKEPGGYPQSIGLPRLRVGGVQDQVRLSYAAIPPRPLHSTRRYQPSGVSSHSVSKDQLNDGKFRPPTGHFSEAQNARENPGLRVKKAPEDCNPGYSGRHVRWEFPCSVSRPEPCIPFVVHFMAHSDGSHLGVALVLACHDKRPCLPTKYRFPAP